MKHEILMPRMGQGMEEGTLLRWIANPGDAVSRGEPLVEIETDKATMEIESFFDGILAETVVSEGETVPVGTVLGYIVDSAGAADSRFESVPEQPRQAGRPGVTSRQPAASPLARRLAREHGIDLATVRPTGPGGRIGKDDILRVLAEAGGSVPATFSSSDSIVSARRKREFTGLQRATARKTTISKNSVPHFYVTAEADLTALRVFRESCSPADRPGFTSILVHAVSKTLQSRPSLNARWSGDDLYLYDDIHISLAVATGRGLVAPVLHRCQVLDLPAVDAAVRNLVARARDRALQEDDLADGTFSVSNLGMYDIVSVTPIVNSPEIAILGLGGPRAVFRQLEDGGNATVQMLTLTVAADHRALDGADVADFLGELKKNIEVPSYPTV